MKNQLFKKAAIATFGVVTVVTLSLATTSAPALAGSHSTKSSQALVKNLRQGGKALKLGIAVEQGNEHGTKVKTADLAFTVTGVPEIVTTAGQIAGKLVFKVIPLAADATVAPATPPALNAHQNKVDGKFKIGANPNESLSLTNSTLSGAIKIRGLKNGAGVQNFAVYPFLAADVRSGLAAQTGAPVFVIATTSVDGTVSLSGQSGNLTIDLTQNTGSIKSPQTVTVNVPNDGKLYALQVIRTSVLDREGNTHADAAPQVVATIGISDSGTQTVTLPELKPGSYTFNLVALQAQVIDVNVGSDGVLTNPLVIG
ncbi:MAG: hypothetical protein RLZ28_118 [Actinomycetota bacterium]